MSQPFECYALMKGGRIYTLQPLKKDRDCPLSRSGFRYIAYCDGARCGVFKTKKAFEEFVAREPDFESRGPFATATSRAVTWSQFEGKQILQRLEDDQQARIARRREGGSA